MVGTAVNVKEAPAQAGLVPVVKEAETAGATDGLIVIVIPALVAVVGLAQAELEVITQVTTCPLVNVLDVNVALLVPALTPFTFHW